MAIPTPSIAACCANADESKTGPVRGWPVRIAEHIAKADRFEARRAELDPVDDFELWFWMGLSAGTALINAALHAAGITEENDRFATQVPDVYAVPGDREWSPKIAFSCDLIHVGLPAIESSLPSAIRRAFDAMEVIEHYRDPCVRGDHPVTKELIMQIDAAYNRCVGAAREVIGSASGGSS